jgi:hypothetical protein
MMACRVIDHRDYFHQDRPAHPQPAVFDLPAIERPRGRAALDNDFDFRSSGNIIRRVDVGIRDGTEKPMRNQATFDFVPDLAEAGIKLLA